MTTDWDNVDLDKMQQMYKISRSKLSYEEWFAVQLVNHANGDDKAVVFKDSPSSTGLEQGVSTAKVAGSSPAGKAIAQAKRDEALKKTVLKADKSNQKSIKKKKATKSKPKAKTAPKESKAIKKVVGKGDVTDTDFANIPEAIDNKQNTTDKSSVSTASDTQLVDKEPLVVEMIPLDDEPLTDRELGQIDHDNKKPHSDVLADKEDKRDFHALSHLDYGLTAKQFHFCLHYIRHLNATKSYRDAYGVTNNSTAEANGHKTLRNAKVQVCLNALFDIRRGNMRRKTSANELAKSADAVLERVAELANADLSNFIRIGEDGIPRYDFIGVDPSDLRGITGMKIKQGKVVEYEGGEAVDIPVYEFDMKMDPKGASALLMKHHGLLVEKLEIDDKRETNPQDLARRMAFMLMRGKSNGQSTDNTDNRTDKSASVNKSTDKE